MVKVRRQQPESALDGGAALFLVAATAVILPSIASLFPLVPFHETVRDCARLCDSISLNRLEL